MAGFLDKAKIRTATGKINHFDLSGDHITTANFMEFSPIYNIEMVPNSKIELNVQTFSRLSPMPQPTFGSCLINNRAFFVPYRVVWKSWTDFITNARRIDPVSGVLADLSSVPYILNSQLIALFTGRSIWHEDIDEDTDWDNILCIRYSGGSSEAYDFINYDNNQYRLSPKGRYFLKVIESLGYKIDFSLNPDVVVYYSALPLLCVTKIYCDWYYSSQYAQYTAAFVEVAKYFEHTSTFGLDYDAVFNCLSLIEHVNYDSDYFTSNWDNPVSPNPNSDSSSPSFFDPVVSDVEVTGADTDGAPVIHGTSDVLSRFSQVAIDALHKLSDFMKRHQLAGARALDRYLARFGIKLSAEKLNRSVYCGKQNFVVQFGDVMSHSDTDGANLGSYAGKGVAYDPNGKFSFDTDEYGMFFVINSIVPQIGYVQGVDKIVTHLSPQDFYTPEFDNLSVQATSAAELFIPFGKEQLNSAGTAPVDTTLLHEHVFGYLPRYSEYKVGKSRLTGDFRYGSVNVGKEGWHLFRMFSFKDFDFQSSNVNHSPDFISGKDSNQYLRLFYNTEDVQDYFNLVHRFGVKFSSPMKPMYDVYDFDEAGKEITVDVNGVNAN